MSSEQSEKDRLIIALRRGLPLLILAGLGLWGYLDLRSRIERPEEQVAAVDDVRPAREATAEAEADRPPQPVPPAAPESDSTWACGGSISTKELARVLQEHGASVTECYKGLLSVLPEAQGIYIIDLQVAADGTVMDSRMRGTLRDEQLDMCVEKVLPSWRFAPLEVGNCAAVTVPYRLTPENVTD